MRTGPAGAWAAARQASRLAASPAASASSSAVATSTSASGPVSATAQRSGTGTRAGRRPRRGASGTQPAGPAGVTWPSLPRADASASASSAAASSGPGGSPPGSPARHNGGMAPASSAARGASGPVSTVRQDAVQPSLPGLRPGRTRPRVHRSRPNRATAAQ